MNRVLKWILIILAILIIGLIGVVAYSVLVEKTPYIGPDGEMAVKKPAVYLYPVEDSFVKVKLDINGKITKDIPAYSGEWNVFATKEGIIDGRYDYLFYEAELNHLELPNEGWIVSYNELDSWFSSHLAEMGLNEKETSQFKDYWLNKLPQAQYYEIKLLDKEFLINNMNLIVTPTPDSMIRVELYFKPVNDKIVLTEPSINKVERNGFTVVEWGGILDQKHDVHHGLKAVV